MPLSGPRARQSKSAYQNQQLSSATVDWSFIVCTTGLVPVQMVLCMTQIQMTQNGLWNNKNPYAVRTMSLWEAASQRKDFCLAQTVSVSEADTIITIKSWQQCPAQDGSGVIWLFAHSTVDLHVERVVLGFRVLEISRVAFTPTFLLFSQNLLFLTYRN